MAYADSAIDYNYSIHNINLDQKLMTVTYYTSVSDGRPTVYRNIYLSPSEFNDSDIRVKAESVAEEVVSQWDQILEANSVNPAFDPDDFIGDSYSARFKPHVSDSVPPFNHLTQEVTSYDSEGYDEIRTKYSVSAMNESDKAAYRNNRSYLRPQLWNALLKEDRLDSAATVLGLYSGSHDSQEINFLVADGFSFTDPVLVELRSVLGYNDSDFASIMEY